MCVYLHSDILFYTCSDIVFQAWCLITVCVYDNSKCNEDISYVHMSAWSVYVSLIYVYLWENGTAYYTITENVIYKTLTHSHGDRGIKQWTGPAPWKNWRAASCSRTLPNSHRRSWGLSTRSLVNDPLYLLRLMSPPRSSHLYALPNQ